VAALCQELRAAWFGDPVIIVGTMPAAIAAAVPAIAMIFFGQDYQTIFVEIEIDAFNQLFHGWEWFGSPGRGCFFFLSVGV